ncbi:hypothetical protein HF313_12935 [Massilia atriviolacea]|uniref:DUF2059 domain-containing protein n=1 Tax=Massilia atriviolacea TaxID=2495579 RepID=A0A430HQ53_9BURK|nr:hypothetical protein [Massilia atriviolacea]RSZ59651.1 hypothetical protein EJB06_05485 [Massilia atriviolacea]
MHTSLISAGRYAATALLFTLAMAQAHAAPATKESLRRYFEVAKVASLTDNAIETISAAQARDWKEETDPKEKAGKKAVYDKADQTIRKYINWPVLEPLAIESYQKLLDEADVQGMTVHAQGPVGQLITNKLTPALIAQLPAIGQHIEQRVDAIIDQDDAAPKPAVAPPAPPANRKEALARTMLGDYPGVREEFDAMMGTIEARMMQSAAMFMGEQAAKMEAQMKTYGARIRDQITFDEITALKARLLADALSEAEMHAIIDDNKKPARRAQLVKAKKAEAELQVRMNTYLQEKVFPVLVPELVKIIGTK